MPYTYTELDLGVSQDVSQDVSQVLYVISVGHEGDQIKI